MRIKRDLERLFAGALRYHKDKIDNAPKGNIYKKYDININNINLKKLKLGDQTVYGILDGRYSTETIYAIYESIIEYIIENGLHKNSEKYLELGNVEWYINDSLETLSTDINILNVKYIIKCNPNMNPPIYVEVVDYRDWFQKGVDAIFPRL